MASYHHYVIAVRTSVTTDAAGRRVLAKVAGNAEEALRLEHEAAQLEAARHPGVVELVGVDGHGIGSILLTAHVDGPTLAEVGRLPLEESAGLLAALASTLADLHVLGLVHGAVCPEHVIVGPGGRPVLCGLAYGGRSGEPAGPPALLPREFADPAREAESATDPSSDVFALGALARFLAPEFPAGHVLARVAAEALSNDPSARPTARALAEALQEEVPAARLPRGLASPPPARPPSTPSDPLAALRSGGAGRGAGSRPALPPAGVLVGVAAAAAGLIVAVALAGSRPGPAAPVTSEVAEPAPALALDPPPPEEVQPGPTTTRSGLASSSTTITTTTTTTTTTRPVARRADCAAANSVLQADVDGDGCPEALRYADGVLEAGSVRWSLGQPGDQAATGDWSCQGARTIALFRPATGELFRFDGWAGPGQDLTATALARIPDGQALRAADVDRDGCHEAVVERSTGVAEIVRLLPVRP